MNKKHYVIFGLVSLAAVAVVITTWLFGWGNKGTNSIEIQPTPTTHEISYVELDEANKPEISLTIENDRSGAHLSIGNIDDQFTEIEYELIYLAESDQGQEIERGVAGGPLEIGGLNKMEEFILFGTESCTTGTCRRHIDKNVSGGTLVVRLLTGEQRTWKFEENFDIVQSDGGYQVEWAE